MDNPKITMNNFRGAKLREVVEVTVAEGKGVPGDPVREVVYYMSPGGKVLAVRDRVNVNAVFCPGD